MLEGCSKPRCRHYLNLLVDKLSLCTIKETSSSSVDTGALARVATNGIRSDRPSRYAFRSEEKVALQEIGPRFTLKLRWLKKNIPAVINYGESAAPLTIEKDEEDDPVEESENKEESEESKEPKERPRTVPPKVDEFLWQWKVRRVPLSSKDPTNCIVSLAGLGDIQKDVLPVVVACSCVDAPHVRRTHTRYRA